MSDRERVLVVGDVFDFAWARELGRRLRGVRLTNAGAPIGRRRYEHLVVEV